jgi:hypothetical protein
MLLGHRDNAIGLGVWERPEQHGVDGGEDSGSATDAEGNRQQRRGGETGVASEKPKGLANVLNDGAHEILLNRGLASPAS